MLRQARPLWFGLCAFVTLFGCLPAFAHGDKIIPYVPDGTGADTRYRTKFDITNLGPLQDVRITNVKLLFFQRNGQPWNVPTNLGTRSEIPLDLGKFQTIRIETLGTGALSDGYAILRSTEGTTVFSEDFEPAITVFYEVLRGGSVIDTVSVPVGQPTRSWAFPSQTETANELLTGFAIVNLSDQANSVQLDPWGATTPSSSSAASGGTASFSLNPRELRVSFLHQAGFFPNLTSFKGMVLGASDRPVAILALLQTRTPTGVQYATMVPAYADALRRNTMMYLREGYPLDADLPISDYWAAETINQDDLPWDLLYQTLSTTARQLTAWSGASFALIGTRTSDQFDNQVTLPYLQGLTYTTNPIDLSNSSPNLASGTAFAIKTGLGRYVKVRIADIIQRDTQRDLALEMYIYK